MKNELGKHYLIIIKLSNPSQTRILTIGSQIRDVLDYVSRGQYELAFMSSSCDLQGYFVRSTLPARRIRAEIESPGKTAETRSRAPVIEPFLENGDGVFVTELGLDFDGGAGFSRPVTWLQRH